MGTRNLDFVIQCAALPPQAGKGALFKFASGFNVEVSKLPSSSLSSSSRQVYLPVGQLPVQLETCELRLPLTVRVPAAVLGSHGVEPRSPRASAPFRVAAQSPR
jgi:hypothetical protein